PRVRQSILSAFNFAASLSREELPKQSLTMRRTPTSMSDLTGDYSSLVPRAKFNPLIHRAVKLRLLPPSHQDRPADRSAGQQMAGRLLTLGLRARRAIRKSDFGWMTSRAHHARSFAVGPSGTLPAQGGNLHTRGTSGPNWRFLEGWVEW